MNKFRTAFLAGSVMVLMLLLSSAASAQVDGREIKFRGGRSAATVKGTVGKGGPDFYFLGAKAGQTMTIEVTGKVSFGVDSPDEALTDDDGNKIWSQELPADGNYKIRVYSLGGAQSYSLTVTIK
jgi:hypothetical protein